MRFFFIYRYINACICEILRELCIFMLRFMAHSAIVLKMAKAQINLTLVTFISIIPHFIAFLNITLGNVVSIYTRTRMVST